MAPESKRGLRAERAALARLELSAAQLAWLEEFQLSICAGEDPMLRHQVLEILSARGFAYLQENQHLIRDQAQSL